jgi:hypothetical protein
MVTLAVSRAARKNIAIAKFALGATGFFSKFAPSVLRYIATHHGPASRTSIAILSSTLGPTGWFYLCPQSAWEGRWRVCGVAASPCGQGCARTPWFASPNIEASLQYARG